MKLHMLTLSWNGLDKLERLYPGLCKSASACGIESEWYIRDNGSKDATVEKASDWNGVKTTVFPVGHNRDSFAQGMNFLFDKASPEDGDVVLLLNNDVVFDNTDSILAMINLMRKTNAGVVGAKLLFTDTKQLQHAGVIFGPQYGNMPYHFRAKETPDIKASKNRYFQAVTAAVCLVKAKSFKRIGGMDEGFRWAFEDIDMCLRIGQDEKIVYCGQTSILHDESATLKKNPVQKMFMSSNVGHFKSKWWKGQETKYILDHSLYLKNENYNEIKD